MKKQFTIWISTVLIMMSVLFLTNFCKKDSSTPNPLACVGNGYYYHTSGTIMILPNAFTPNGDGLNDKFGVVGSGFTKFSMTIKDTKAVVLFSDSSMLIWWDGKNKSGNIVEGHYKVTISFKNSTGTTVNMSMDVMLYTTALLKSNSSGCKFGDQIDPKNGFVTPTLEVMK